MKKAKRTNNINKAIRQATKYDFTYKGFAIDHEEKMIWVMESLFSEVFLLLAVFAYLFYSGITSILLAEIVFLVVEVYLTAHILLGIIRSITHLYCVFYSP